MKECNRCLTWKPITAFTFRTGKKSYRSECKECKCEEVVAKYHANPGPKLAYAKAAYAANPEKFIKKSISNYWADPEEARKKGRASGKRNLHKYRAKKTAYEGKRRAGKLKATPKWLTTEQITEIQNLYIKAREIQAKTGVEQHVDHIMPLKNPILCGLHVPWNLRIIPAFDNHSKHNKIIEGL